jgi:hypothetical protein
MLSCGFGSNCSGGELTVLASSLVFIRVDWKRRFESRPHPKAANAASVGTTDRSNRSGEMRSFFSERQHAADAVLCVHEIERGAHVVETHPLREERVDIDAAAEIAVGELWSLFATTPAAERSSATSGSWRRPRTSRSSGSASSSSTRPARAGPGAASAG